MTIRKYSHQDPETMFRIWNEVVEEGISFPQEEILDVERGDAFFYHRVIRVLPRKKG